MQAFNPKLSNITHFWRKECQLIVGVSLFSGIFRKMLNFPAIIINLLWNVTFKPYII